MQMGSSWETIRMGERRYRPETVRKAAALAARLQEEHRETLSENEVAELAEEIGIDPRLMRHALAAVAQNDRAAPAALQPHNWTSLLTGLIIPLALAVAVLWALAVRVGAPVATAVLASGEPALVRNPSFEATNDPYGARTFHAHSTGVPGWTVAQGTVTRTVGGTDGYYGLQLGPEGAVQQLIPTHPGQRYLVTVAVSGTPGREAQLHHAVISVPGDTKPLSAYTDARGGRPARWTRDTLEFEAKEAATPIEISIDRSRPDAGAPVVDDIRVIPTL